MQVYCPLRCPCYSYRPLCTLCVSGFLAVRGPARRCHTRKSQLLSHSHTVKVMSHTISVKNLHWKGYSPSVLTVQDCVCVCASVWTVHTVGAWPDLQQKKKLVAAVILCSLKHNIWVSKCRLILMCCLCGHCNACSLIQTDSNGKAWWIFHTAQRGRTTSVHTGRLQPLRESSVSAGS